MYKMSVGQDAGGRGSSAWERTWRRLLCNAAAALAAVLLYVKPHSMAQSLNVTEKQEPLCQPSSLQSRQISPEYGCEEIQEMLAGETKLVGSGWWRDVYRVNYRDQHLVIKTLKNNMIHAPLVREHHRREEVALDTVQDCENIVRLIGACNNTVVTEYFSGNMEHRVRNRGNSTVEIREVMQMALDAAHGLQALHDAPGGPIVHADLKLENLLIDNNNSVKVNDLNMCHIMGREDDGSPCPFPLYDGPVDPNRHQSFGERRNVWRAPETFPSDQGVTELIDIYALGIIYWSLLAGKLPSVYQVDKSRDLGWYIDPAWHKGFAQLFKDMWRTEPQERPSAGQVVERLEIMLMAEEPPTR